MSTAVMLLLAGCPAPQDTGGGNDNDADVNDGNDTQNDNGAPLDNENDNDNAANDNNNGNGITTAIVQPEQPTQGPGSSNYVHQQVRTSEFGSGTEAYFLYEPAEPTPESAAPVVAFMHGFGGVNPAVYGPWIAHIRIVVGRVP